MLFFALWSLYYRFSESKLLFYNMNMLSYIVVFLRLFLNKLSSTFCSCNYKYGGKHAKVLYRFAAQNSTLLTILMETYVFIKFLFLVAENSYFKVKRKILFSIHSGNFCLSLLFFLDVNAWEGSGEYIYSFTYSENTSEYLICSRPCADSWPCTQEEKQRTFLFELRVPVLKVHPVRGAWVVQ